MRYVRASANAQTGFVQSWLIGVRLPTLHKHAADSRIGGNYGTGCRETDDNKVGFLVPRHLADRLMLSSQQPEYTLSVSQPPIGALVLASIPHLQNTARLACLAPAFCHPRKHRSKSPVI